MSKISLGAFADELEKISSVKQTMGRVGGFLKDHKKKLLAGAFLTGAAHQAYKHHKAKKPGAKKRK